MWDWQRSTRLQPARKKDVLVGGQRPRACCSWRTNHLPPSRSKQDAQRVRRHCAARTTYVGPTTRTARTGPCFAERVPAAPSAQNIQNCGQREKMASDRALPPDSWYSACILYVRTESTCPMHVELVHVLMLYMSGGYDGNGGTPAGGHCCKGTSASTDGWPRQPAPQNH